MTDTNSFKFTCCITYTMGLETVVHLYGKQPWFNHLVTTCPGCSNVAVGYRLQDQALEHLRVFNTVEWAFADFAPDEVVAAYGEAYGLSLLTVRELNQRHERLINWMHWLLANREAELESW